jgi:hypothetical protein
MHVVPPESEFGRLVCFRDCIGPSRYTVMKHLPNRGWSDARSKTHSWTTITYERGSDIGSFGAALMIDLMTTGEGFICTRIYWQ